MSIVLTSIACLLVTTGIYITFTSLKKKYNKEYFSPIIFGIGLTIVFLLTFNISYAEYNYLGNYISYLLTAAITCLAIPLYKQIPLLMKNLKPIILGIFIGSTSSLVGVFVLSWIFNLNYVQLITLLPTSVTSGVAVEMSRELGGIVPVTIAVVIVTGIFGNLFAVPMLNWFKIKSPVAKGIAIGASSHVFGTIKAMELGETEGAASSLALVLGAIITVVVMALVYLFI